MLGLHVGYIDTPMTKGLDVPKNEASAVVSATLDGLEAREYEVLADELSANVKAGLAGKIEDLYAGLPRP